MGGEERVEETILDWERAGLLTRHDLDPTFWRDVARIKADIRRVSLGDNFAIALARRAGGAVVTADRAAIGPVADRGMCTVNFIR